MKNAATGSPAEPTNSSTSTSGSGDHVQNKADKDDAQSSEGQQDSLETGNTNVVPTLSEAAPQTAKKTITTAQTNDTTTHKTVTAVPRSPTPPPLFCFLLLLRVRLLLRWWPRESEGERAVHRPHTHSSFTHSVCVSPCMDSRPHLIPRGTHIVCPLYICMHTHACPLVLSFAPHAPLPSCLAAWAEHRNCFCFVFIALSGRPLSLSLPVCVFCFTGAMRVCALVVPRFGFLFFCKFNFFLFAFKFFAGFFFNLCVLNLSSLIPPFLLLGAITVDVFFFSTLPSFNCFFCTLPVRGAVCFPPNCSTRTPTDTLLTTALCASPAARMRRGRDERCAEGAVTCGRATRAGGAEHTFLSLLFCFLCGQGGQTPAAPHTQPHPAALFFFCFAFAFRVHFFWCRSCEHFFSSDVFFFCCAHSPDGVTRLPSCLRASLSPHTHTSDCALRAALARR
ncbi:hypothetical protein ECC02_011847 [Trypanosoma cruzi]|uniref:Uncharacterized protein n=1 Tax=Trypanosoma cruzi TaxID=5693 RepID=A0A7J6XLU6_TRYCR|nr:hypothetical protein ECC02_011847 [Trypanosoma cruzi]